MLEISYPELRLKQVILGRTGAETLVLLGLYVLLSACPLAPFVPSLANLLVNSSTCQLVNYIKILSPSLLSLSRTKKLERWGGACHNY